VIDFAGKAVAQPGFLAFGIPDLGGSLMAYDFAKRLKTLRGLTPMNTSAKSGQPKRFRLNPLHHTVGLNT
jgi:hypothetical protein